MSKTLVSTRKCTRVNSTRATHVGTAARPGFLHTDAPTMDARVHHTHIHSPAAICCRPIYRPWQQEMPGGGAAVVQRAQQQPFFPVLSPAGVKLTPAAPPAGCESLGNFRAIATNNSFTFEAVLADVSMNMMPDSSQYAWASYVHDALEHDSPRVMLDTRINVFCKTDFTREAADLALDLSLDAQIRFVSGQGNHNVWTALSLQLFDPSLCSVKRFLFSTTAIY